MTTELRAIRDNAISIKFNFSPNTHNIHTLLHDYKHKIITTVRREAVMLRNSIKWYLVAHVNFKKIINNENVTTTSIFRSRTERMLLTDDLDEQYSVFSEKICESVGKFTRDGSGWIENGVRMLEVNIVKYHPLVASSFIPTPSTLHATKSVVNVRNNDEKCFLWSVLAGLHPIASNPHRVRHYVEYENELNMTGIPYPVEVNKIVRFEIQNVNVSVNVFGYEENEVYPLRITEHRARAYHVNLLLLSDYNNSTHYCLIRDMSRLLFGMTKNRNKKFFCNYCLHRFCDNTNADDARQRLEAHQVHCSKYGAQKVKLPAENDKWMYFKDYTLCHRVPYTVYADFESFIVPIARCSRNVDSSHSDNVAQHIPASFCYVIVDWTGKAIAEPVLYRGKNVVSTFLQMLMNDVETLDRDFNAPMQLTDDEQKRYENSTHCHLCKKRITTDRVRNHCHITGQFLGAAHSVCNLNFKIPKHVPVFFHNMSGYDCHHLMQGFGKYKNAKMSCIATTSERFISVTLGSLRFLDSLRFMNTSLEKLVSNLSKDKFKILQQFYTSNVDLLLRKGVYPYEYVTNESKFIETQLPAREHFYSTLTESSVTDDDYAHANTVWSSFNMRTFGEYHDLYLKTDVLLLADVFENFRNMSLQYYELDPCNMYTAAGLAWNAMLKMTNVRLELLTDIDQHLYIEESVRGGVAMIPHRYCKANNPYVPDYDANKPHNYIMYLDCTNLYGTAMTQNLPISDFRWLDNNEIRALNVHSLRDDSDIGYILEVDLCYPQHLHDLHTDYPLAPEKRTITDNMLSPYCMRMKLLKNFSCSTATVEKLVTSLEDKKSYIVHYRTLKLYLELGMVLKAVHRVLTFRQHAWLKPFIEFNTAKRKVACNAFEKDFFKLMNNAPYGKSLENVRKRTDFKLVANQRQLHKLTANPRLQHFFVYNEDLVGISMKKPVITLNRPLYVGTSVLDISKLIMYRFHYGFIVNTYGPRVRLCMTDTDSLLYFIQTDDVYKDIEQNLALFDTSDYPTTHPCYCEVNKKKLGTFKDETNGVPILEFVGLRAKCYSLITVNNNEKKVAKGVPRVAIVNQLKHQLYKDCVKTKCQLYTTAQTIRSEQHILYTKQIAKQSLSPYDDKRYILDDGESTFAYGHYKIQTPTVIQQCRNSVISFAP